MHQLKRFVMRKAKMIPDERLMEIAAIIPVPDDDSPEITEAEATKACFAHESHPEWYRTVPVKQQISKKRGVFAHRTGRNVG